MKNEDDQLDEFLRSKLGNKQFELKDEYWQNARILLDNNRPAKKRIGFFLFISAITAIALLALALTKKQQDVPQFTQTHQPVIEAELLAENSVLINNQSLNNQDEIKNDYMNTQLNVVSVSNTNLKSQAIQNNHTDQKVIADKPVLLKEKKSKINKTDVKPITSGSETSMQNAEQNDVQVSGAKPVQSSFLIAPKWKNSIDVQLSIQPQMAANSSSQKALNSQSFKLLQGGLTYYNPESHVLNNINFHFSAIYYKGIGNRLYAGAGVGYSRLHQNNGKRNYNFITDGFGEQTESIGINTIRLDYFELPLGLMFVLNNKSRINAGVSMNYLIQSADLVKQKGKVKFDEETNGYYQAFNRLDVQTYLGFGYSLSSHWLANVSYYFGVTDITKTSSFKSERFDNNKGLRLSIGYQFH